jgi:hypothetical protein
MEWTMKRGLALFTAAAMCLAMTACGENAIPDMTEEEMQTVGEYAAITMMKYDANHRSRLVELPSEEVQVSTVEQTPEVQPETTETVEQQEPAASVEQQQEEAPVTLTEAAGLPEGVSLDYLEYEICDQYPADGSDAYFSVTASEGNSLLVAKFALTNGTSSEAAVDFLSNEGAFKLTVNGDYTRRALTTMLLNDLSTFQGTIAPGESQEAVLVIELEGDGTETISNLSLSLKIDSETYTINLF